jgi:hypothetical protein
MAISHLKPPRAYAGDAPSPFAADGRELKIVVALPLPDEGPDVAWASHDALTMPDPVRLLWALGLRDDIDLYWLGAPADRDVPARVEVEPPDRGVDHLPYRTITTSSAAYRAVWPYSPWERLAQDSSIPLDDVHAAGVTSSLRADLLVTSNGQLIEATDRPFSELNIMSSTDALAVIGLFLRTRGIYEMAPPKGLVFGEHLLLWTAVRAMLPNGWAWSHALVHYSHQNDLSSPTLLHGSLHQRLVRALRYRDQLQAALLVRQNNDTADHAAEALDNFLVNVVGAFDAAARAAHLCAGLPSDRRHLAGWQKADWLRSLNTPDLEALHAEGTPGHQLFKVCRLLRNTVHGEGLQTTSVQSGGKPMRTLVALPEDDAADLQTLLRALGSDSATWGLEPLTGREEHLDPGMFVEELLPRVLALLDETLRLSPVDRLGVASATTGPPNTLDFGPGTRARATLMLGLKEPAT